MESDVISFIYAYGSILLGGIQGLIYARFNNYSYCKYLLTSILFNFSITNSLLWLCYSISKKQIFTLSHMYICNYSCFVLCVLFIIILELLFFKFILKYRYSTRVSIMFWTISLFPLMVFSGDGNFKISPKQELPNEIQLVLSNNDYYYIQENQKEKRVQENDFVFLQKEDSFEDKEVKIKSNPHGGIFVIDSKRKMHTINIQSLFYRWSPAQISYLKKYQYVFLYTNNENFMYDLRNHVLYNLPQGLIIGYVDLNQ